MGKPIIITVGAFINRPGIRRIQTCERNRSSGKKGAEAPRGKESAGHSGAMGGYGPLSEPDSPIAIEAKEKEREKEKEKEKETDSLCTFSSMAGKEDTFDQNKLAELEPGCGIIL